MGNSIRAAALAFVLIGISPPSLAGSFECESQPSAIDTVACYGVAGVVLVLGAGSVLLSEIKSAITPDIDVFVRLDSGEIINGKITSKAAQGRTVSAGDTVTLKCKYDTTLEKIEPLCTLFYPELAPMPQSVDYYQRKGYQAPYFVAVSEDGVPQKSILTLERPLRWKDGHGN